MDGQIDMRSASATEFRELLGRFATGVAVITAADATGRVAAMTASAVTAVSLDPPLLLVCVNHEDPLHDMLHDASVFAVNVLARDQANLSDRCAAAPARDRLGGVRYRSGPDGVPLLDGVAAQILCVPWGVYPGGDHTIFVGRVTGGTTSDAMPLLHWQGRYTTTGDDA